MFFSEVKEAIEDAFNAYAAVTPLRFSYKDEGGDLSVRFVPFSAGSPATGRASIKAVEFNSNFGWMYMDASNRPLTGKLDVLTVALHEIGHTLGLDDNTEPYSVMRGWYKHPWTTDKVYNRPQLSAEDIQRIQALYGKNTEPTTTKGPRTPTPKWNVTTTERPLACRDFAVNCNQMKGICPVVPDELKTLCSETCGLCENGLYKAGKPPSDRFSF